MLRKAFAGRSVLKTLAASLTACLGAVQANPVNTSYLDGLLRVSPDSITAYGHDLFGDKVNLFNGALEFEHTDLSLPGNSALPVALVRKHVPGRSEMIRGPFGDWDLEVPRIGGSFSTLQGWVTGGGGTNRCSGFSLPPVVSSGTGFATSAPNPVTRSKGTVSPPAPIAASAPQDANVIVSFIASDYWQGTHIHVPGHGVQEVLTRATGYTLQPTDGASYPLVTRNNWQVSCLPTVQNHTGEGFLAVSPDGVRYRFDWMASRLLPNVKKAAASIGRQEMFLLATEVTDRFGNWVRYSYNPASPQQLNRIESKDGRVITLSYTAGRISAASDGTRSFTYGYSSPGNLATAQRPDGSRWTFNLAPMVAPQLLSAGEGATCDSTGDFPIDVLTGTITHPSGAVGTFTTSFTMLGRTFVDRVCVPHPRGKSLTIGAVYPRYVSTQSLTSKQISGPGLAPMQWSFEYTAPGGWTTCTTCSEVRTTLVTEPDGNQTRHTFGNRWRVNEGQLLQVDEGWNGSTALRTTSHRYRVPTAADAFPEQFGTSLLPKSDWLASRLRPMDRRIIVQQGNSFTWEALSSSQGFDNLARPFQVRKFSSLGYTRTDMLQYSDQHSAWVLGQVSRLYEATTATEVESHVFDPTTALPLSTRQYGRPVYSYVHNPDGTLDTIRDAAGRPTRLTSWRRGKPQQITHRDGAIEQQVINNLGDSDSQTNAAGTTTSFQYDPMGRVSVVTYSAGLQTTQTFEQLTGPAYGLPAGHWRQTISTGNARKVRHFDALWRERVSFSLDAANPSGTSSFRESRYDWRGAKAFESYPERSFTVVDEFRFGTATVRDALARVSRQTTDSELGPLTRTSAYPATAFQRVDTTARGHASVFSFQAFDEPTNDRIVSIQAPEGVMVSMQRDTFGKPIVITRGGGGLSVTRRYAYDPFHRLCMTVEPESGGTLQDYDLAGNVAWRASGIAADGISACNQVAAPLARRAQFAYDARDRLVSTTYGDGSPWIARSYTRDGLPETISTPTSTWTLGYNSRRLMDSETFTSVLGTYTFTYGIDSYGNVASMSYPGGPTLSFSPDALGRATQISGYLSGITYHSNDQITGYTAGNGVAYTMTPNLRGLPETLRYGSVATDLHTYDANGNLTAIIDQQLNQATRSMAYDGLDRLKVASGIWGLGQFSYDAVDNLRTSQIGSRVLNHQYDATNRLIGVTGSFSATLSYDLNGNVSNRAGQGYVFDIANRMTTATNLANYIYDGNGRRAWTGTAAGRSTLRVYGQSGRLLLTSDSTQGVTRHIYLGDKIVAESNTQTGTRWIHTDILGSPVAATGPMGQGQVLERTRYEPYGLTAAGTNPTGIGFTGHVNDADTGLVYMQQRYYDPIAGRFLSVDPVVTDTKTGKDFGRYTYVDNNPYSKVDPDGRQGVGPTNLFPNFDPIQYLKDVAVEAAKFVGMASAGAGGAAVKGIEGVAAAAGTRGVAGAVANPVPSTMARVIPEGVPAATLGRPGVSDVFVTGASDIAGLNASQIATRLTIPESATGFKVIEFATPRSGVASPVFRSDAGFVGGGRTAGGAREFVIPNGPVPADAVFRVVQ